MNTLRRGLYWSLYIVLLTIALTIAQETNDSYKTNPEKSIYREATIFPADDSTDLVSDFTCKDANDTSFSSTNSSIHVAENQILRRVDDRHENNLELSNTISNDIKIMNRDFDLTADELSAEPTANSSDCDRSNGIIVTQRTSSMFMANITYNCTLEQTNELFVVKDGEIIVGCNVTEILSPILNNIAINVTCENITGNAGRDWEFYIGTQNNSNSAAFNETFKITFSPLDLSLFGEMNIREEIKDDNLTLFVSIPNCTEICDVKYLEFRCDTNDSLNVNLSENCTHTCHNVNFGSIYNLSLVRLPIPIADKAQGEEEDFPRDDYNQTHRTSLDTPKKFTVEFPAYDKKIAEIRFDCPRGNFDEIYFGCSEKDSTCKNNTTPLTNVTYECQTSNIVSIMPVTRGMSYECQATTNKSGFPEKQSDKFRFNTTLEPVTIESGAETRCLNSTEIVFNPTTESDFSHLELACITQTNQSPCVNLNKTENECKTLLQVNGTFGCAYKCFITTIKYNYNNIDSINYTIQIYPPVPRISAHILSSSSINLTWSTNSPSYINRFYVFLNGSNKFESFIAEGSECFHPFNNLSANRNYSLTVIAASSYLNQTSESVIVRTFEDVPDEPNAGDVLNKISPLSDDANSKEEQFVVEFDLSLFTDDNGCIDYYEIYVRQNQERNTSQPCPVGGSYDAAFENNSLDYIALNLTRPSSIPCSFRFPPSTAKTTDSIILLTIGNETCHDNVQRKKTCNGKLKPATIYKLLVGACLNGACRYVLSSAFTTKARPPPPPIDSSSSSWVYIVVPILIVLFVTAALAIWKRDVVKKYLGTTQRNGRKSRSQEISVPMSEHTGSKPITEYINIDEHEEKRIFAEFQNLQNTSRKSNEISPKSAMSVYDRYGNILARGAWDTTAVRLIGAHRSHDYINANEVESYDRTRKYIACQAPLDKTCKDFWDMIIQYKVKQILMLTKFEENGAEKCFRYYPQQLGEESEFKDIKVHIVDLKQYPHSHLEIRRLIVTPSYNKNIVHEVFHYHFTGWADFKGLEPLRLISLVKGINRDPSYFDLKTSASNIFSVPIVVHCSAGVGRTGTYIAVDTIYRILDRPTQELKVLKLNIKDIVYKLREQRNGMVQTQEQYLLIYRCVKEILRQNVIEESHIYDNFPSDIPYSKPRIPIIDYHIGTNGRRSQPPNFENIGANQQYGSTPKGLPSDHRHLDNNGRNTHRLTVSDVASMNKRDHNSQRSSGTLPSRSPLRHHRLADNSRLGGRISNEEWSKRSNLEVSNNREEARNLERVNYVSSHSHSEHPNLTGSQSRTAGYFSESSERVKQNVNFPSDDASMNKRDDNSQRPSGKQPSRSPLNHQRWADNSGLGDRTSNEKQSKQGTSKPEVNLKKP